MVFFPQTYIELWEYTEKEDIPNFFGESSSDYIYVGTYFVDFQNMTPKDTEKEYGKLLEDTYKIYLDTNVPITDTMIIRKQNQTTTYSILGTPQIYNTLIPHIKVLVQKQRKPLELTR